MGKGRDKRRRAKSKQQKANQSKNGKLPPVLIDEFEITRSSPLKVFVNWQEPELTEKAG